MNELTVQTLDLVFETYKSSVWIEMINALRFLIIFFFTNLIRYFRNELIFSLLKCDRLKFWGWDQTKI